MELATVLGCHILSKLCCQRDVFKVSESSGHTQSERLICPLPRVSVKPLPPCMPLLRARQNELQALCLWNSATRLTFKWYNQFWNVRTAQEINFQIKNSCWGWTPARLKWWHSRVGHIPGTQPGEFLLFPFQSSQPTWLRVPRSTEVQDSPLTARSWKLWFLTCAFSPPPSCSLWWESKKYIHIQKRLYHRDYGTTRRHLLFHISKFWSPSYFLCPDTPDTPQCNPAAQPIHIPAAGSGVGDGTCLGKHKDEMQITLP